MNYILVVDDEPAFLKLYRDTLRDCGYAVKTAEDAQEALSAIEKEVPLMVVSDVMMPGIDGITFLRHVREKYDELPFLLVTAYADVRDAVLSLKLGAVDYLEKPIDLNELATAVNDSLGRSAKLPDEVPAEAMDGIIAESPIMQQVFSDVYRVAKSDANVLLTGESGTGKEVLAGFIHNNSLRTKGKLVAVNCAAIPESLLGSELFGHEKGAFTGAASKRAGRFREAEGGTLFLDEIGDMPLDLQPSLLRALENGTVSPLGSDKEIKVDFRLVTATNKNLQEEVAAGRFREDLYYRLNVIAFELPPLRERREDIVPLANYLLAQDSNRSRKLSVAAAGILQQYNWPGNIRELGNIIERIRILCRSDLILPEHLPDFIRDIPLSSTPDAARELMTLKESEVEAIHTALERTNGNRTKAAELLGIGRRTLLYKLKSYNIQ